MWLIVDTIKLAKRQESTSASDPPMPVKAIKGAQAGYIALIVILALVFVACCGGIFYLLRYYPHGGRVKGDKNGTLSEEGFPGEQKRKGSLFGFRAKGLRGKGWVQASGEEEGLGQGDAGQSTLTVVEKNVRLKAFEGMARKGKGGKGSKKWKMLKKKGVKKGEEGASEDPTKEKSDALGLGDRYIAVQFGADDEEEEDYGNDGEEEEDEKYDNDYSEEDERTVWDPQDPYSKPSPPFVPTSPFATQSKMRVNSMNSGRLTPATMTMYTDPSVHRQSTIRSGSPVSMFAESVGEVGMYDRNSGAFEGGYDAGRYDAMANRFNPRHVAKDSDATVVADEEVVGKKEGGGFGRTRFTENL